MPRLNQPMLWLSRRNRNNAMAIFQRARGFFRGRVLFLDGRIFLLCGVILLSGCVRHEPPADITIINGGEPESLDRPSLPARSKCASFRVCLRD